MKKLKIFYVLASVFFMNSCKEKTSSIKTFIFSNESMPFDYSIKLNANDSIYLQTRFPNPEKNEYGILRKEKKDSLFDLLEKIDFSKYKTSYSDEHLQDGEAYRFIIKRDEKIDSIFIYGDNGPKEFYELAEKIKILISKTEFKKLNGKIDFEKLNYKMVPLDSLPKKIEKIIYK
ncbi:MAG: hypothetical protein KA734_08540 [Fluviicola sp.]|nr:hypothetical protein [Fluviicola sp.]